MRLPRLHLGLKVLILFFLISLVPLIVSNVVWFSAVSPPKATTLLISAAFLVTLAAVVFVGLWLAYQITKPIDKLQQGAKIFGQGNLSSRINIQTGDELEDLANAFNDMAYKLERNIGQLSGLINQLKEDKTIISAERNKLAVTLSGITDAVIAVDLARQIIIFNDAAQNLTGYKSQEVLGKQLDQVIRIFDKEQEVTPLNYCPIKTDGIEGVVFSKPNLKIVAKRQAFVNLISGQIAEGLQNNLGCILTLHDVSKEAELERMKLDFVSMAAHELRTPLTSLKGYIHVFSENPTGLSDQQKTYLLRMSISVQKLVGLVENLLNVSRIERGSLTLRLEEVDWVANVKEVVSELLDQAKDKNQELIVIEPTKPLPKVKVDKFRINEVLANLLSNAILYTPAGGKIKVWFDETEDEVITHIQDNGQGIPKEALPHLFTKFFRVRGVLEQGSKGAGLGLYIAKSIVDLHKGKIWAESQEGKGSTFSFSIPINPHTVSQIVFDNSIGFG